MAKSDNDEEMEKVESVRVEIANQNGVDPELTNYETVVNIGNQLGDTIFNDVVNLMLGPRSPSVQVAQDGNVVHLNVENTYEGGTHYHLDKEATREFLRQHPMAVSQLMGDSVVLGPNKPQLRRTLSSRASSEGLHLAEEPIFSQGRKRSIRMVRRDRKDSYTTLNYNQGLESATITIEHFKKKNYALKGHSSSIFDDYCGKWVTSVKMTVTVFSLLITCVLVYVIIDQVYLNSEQGQI